MNDIEGLRDWLIADEVLRIQTMSHDQATRELIAFRSERIEAMSPDELLNICQLKNGTNTSQTK